MIWAQVNEVLDKARGDGNLWVYVAVGIGVLIAVVVLFKIATGRKKPHPDLEKSQREDLADYPPPPAVTGSRRLEVNGVPVRLRLVVIAPTGKHQESITPDNASELLDDVLRGLGGFVATDRPRVKVWPPQLSVAGFAPTFHRLVESPDPEGKPSRWVKLAGPARTGKRPILLGLALIADEPCKLGDVHLETTEWGELLQVSRP
ncbi:MAG TPA: hypothetical protein VKD90_09445 [Gemmataceae bacterium]|nr:hypothetical protein [Gemmataceae bacterium]